MTVALVRAESGEALFTYIRVTVLHHIGIIYPGRQRMADYEKKWLVMIYLSGDNDLSEECVWSLTEIFRAGKSDDVAVVVQIDPRAARIRRFDLNRILKNVRETESADLKDLLSRGTKLKTDNMASVETLKQFITDSKKSHDAQHNMLILSGHSGGLT